jgi:hypothetical protein
VWGDGIELPPEPCDAGNEPIPQTAADPVVHYLHHAGVLLFSSWLTRLQAVHVQGALLKQWLVMVLLEAVNIEQSKYVSWESRNRSQHICQCFMKPDRLLAGAMHWGACVLPRRHFGFTSCKRSLPTEEDVPLLTMCGSFAP